MNQAVISGNLTADIESRQVNEKMVCNFTVAHNNGEQEATFLPVEAWEMDHLPKFLGRGSKVVVQGVLKQKRWKTKDGANRSRLVLSARQVEFMDPKGRQNGDRARGSDADF